MKVLDSMPIVDGVDHEHDMVMHCFKWDNNNMKIEDGFTLFWGLVLTLLFLSKDWWCFIGESKFLLSNSYNVWTPRQAMAEKNVSLRDFPTQATEKGLPIAQLVELLLRGDHLPKYGCFFGKWRGGSSPIQKISLQIYAYLRIFWKKRNVISKKRQGGVKAVWKFSKKKTV